MEKDKEEMSNMRKSIDFHKGYRRGFIEGRLELLKYIAKLEALALKPRPIIINNKEKAIEITLTEYEECKRLKKKQGGK